MKVAIGYSVTGVQQCDDLQREVTTCNFITINEKPHEQSADREYSIDDVWNLYSSKSDSPASVNDSGRFSDKKFIKLEHKQQSKAEDGSCSEAYLNSEESWRVIHAGDISPVLLKPFGSNIEITPPQKILDQKLQENTTTCHSLLNMPTRTNERKRKSVKDTDNYISKIRRLEETTHVTAICPYVRQHAHHSGAREKDIPQESITSCDIAQENRLVTSEETQETVSKTLEECGQEVQPYPFDEARNVKSNAFGFYPVCDGNILSTATTKEYDRSEEKDKIESIHSDLYRNSDLQADLALSSSSYSETDGENNNVRNRCRRKRKRKYEQDEAGQPEQKARCISVNSKFPTQRSRLQPLFLEDNDILIGNLFGSPAKKENSVADEEYSNPYCHSQEMGNSRSKEFIFAGAKVDYPGESFGCPRDTNPNENHESSNDSYSDSYFESSFDDDDSFEEVHDPDLFPLKITPIKRKKKVLPSLRITLLAYRTLRKACENGFACCEEYCWLDWPTASLIRAMSDFT